MISQTSSVELVNKRTNLRAWAKGCFRNFAERVHVANPLLKEEDVVNDMIACYVDNKYDLTALKKVIFPIINR